MVTVATLPNGGVSRTPERRSTYFLGMAVLLLALLILGFARSLFLRDYFGTLDKLGGRELPVQVQLHGIFLTGWFLLFLAQTSLVAVRRTDFHRRLGVAGVVLATLVVAASVWTLVLSVPRDVLAGTDPRVFAARFFANVTTLVLFAGCVAAAVVQRKHPAAHKRLMLLASIAITGQASTRIAPLVGFPETVFAGTIMLAFLLSLVVYDLWAQRRVHPATTWGIAFFVLCFALSAVIRRSEVGRVFVDSL